MRAVIKMIYLLALFAFLIFALVKCTEQPGPVLLTPGTEVRTVYCDDASEVMIGLMMSGRYKSVSGTNNEGKWTIVCTLAQ